MMEGETSTTIEIESDADRRVQRPDLADDKKIAILGTEAQETVFLHIAAGTRTPDLPERTLPPKLVGRAKDRFHHRLPLSR